MEQQQFKVSFSLGTKLLLSVLLLVTVVIGFLDVSTIVLLTEDKRAYTYQAQSTEAVLAGQQFINVAKHTLDTLRQSLASVNPVRPITPRHRSALQSVLDNQSDVLAVKITTLNLNTAKTNVVAEAMQSQLGQRYGASLADLELKSDWLRIGLEDLSNHAFTFFNVSKLGGVPMLAVAFADIAFKAHPKGMPVAFAFIPLADFGEGLTGSNLSIASYSGWVLFSTDAGNLFTRRNIAKDPLFVASTQNPTASGAQEFEDDGVRYLGSYVRPGLDLVVLSRTEWHKAMSATYAMTEKFVLLGLMAIGASMLFGIIFSKTLTAPLIRLYAATREVAAGNFDLKLDEKSRDEIGALSGSFNVMSEKIQELIKSSMDKVRLEGEIAIASTVQQTLIPPPKFENQDLIIRSHYQAASECGGDWWGFFGVGKKVAIFIADATGHGFPSALITAAARSCFSVMHKLAQEDPEFSFSPGAMLSYANRVVYDAASGKIMMTFFAAVLDFETNTLTYSSAGHNPPWLFQNINGKYKQKSLTARGQRLGEARDVPAYEEKSVPFRPHDIIFFYTDGILEGTNHEGNQYGKKRARQVVEKALAGGPDRVIGALMNDFMAHNGDKALDDDVTVAVVKTLKGGMV